MVPFMQNIPSVTCIYHNNMNCTCNYIDPQINITTFKISLSKHFLVEIHNIHDGQLGIQNHPYISPYLCAQRNVRMSGQSDSQRQLREAGSHLPTYFPYGYITHSASGGTSTSSHKDRVSYFFLQLKYF